MSATHVLRLLGQRVRARRQARGMTLRVLAERSGVSQRFLMDLEAGRGNISVRRLTELCESLDTHPAELLAPATTPIADRAIALLGLRGAGKTSIGKRLARRLHVPFVELDRRIETRAGLPLSEVFSLHGEQYYRRLELEALTELVATPTRMVIAVGGGLVTSPEAFALLRERTTTVWLRARATDYWDRVMKQGDRRPMRQHPRAREALKDLVARRESLYAKADVTLDTTGTTVPEAAERLAHQLLRHSSADRFTN